MIFIPGNVPSSKNSKQWTGRFLISSKATQKYIRETQFDWVTNKKQFLETAATMTFPLTVGLYFKRGSKHRFDYINAAQIIFDLMQKYGWIPDDSADFVVPMFMGYCYDKENPGVEIDLLYCYRGLDGNDEIE